MKTFYLIILMFLGLSISLYFNEDGLIGLLPIIAMIIESLITTYSKNLILLKLDTIIVLVLYVIYEFTLKLYLPIIIDIISITIALIGFIKMERKNINVN